MKDSRLSHGKPKQREMQADRIEGRISFEKVDDAEGPYYKFSKYSIDIVSVVFSIRLIQILKF